MTYSELAQRLEGQGMKETQASITSKLARGTFSATFMLSALVALNISSIEVRALCGDAGSVPS